jgi:hypothetical protein
MKLMYLILAASQNPYNIPANSIGLPTTTPTLGDGIAHFLEAAMGLIGGLAVIFLIFGGGLMVMSAGNPARFERGRETVLYAVIGIIVAIGAYAIVAFVAGAVNGGH